MSCLSANINGKGCLSASVSRIGGGLECAVTPLGSKLMATASKLNGGLKVNIGLICTPNAEAYIKVTPEILWFFNEHDVQYVDVISNIKWIVK